MYEAARQRRAGTAPAQSAPVKASKPRKGLGS
jgi:hypothetical protein